MKTLDRTTKYVVSVRDALTRRKHATNTEILDDVRKIFPEVSATTVHRVTARLLDSGEVRLAPPGRNNAMRFDINPSAHDHFMCTVCERLRDTVFSPEIRSQIEGFVGNGCSISGDLTVTGVCKKCKRREQV